MVCGMGNGVVHDMCGRFYTLMVLSTALFDQPPFKNLIVNGLVLARCGHLTPRHTRDVLQRREEDEQASEELPGP